MFIVHLPTCIGCSVCVCLKVEVLVRFPLSLPFMRLAALVTSWQRTPSEVATTGARSNSTPWRECRHGNLIYTIPTTDVGVHDGRIKHKISIRRLLPT